MSQISIQETQEGLKRDVEGFIAKELDPADVVSISESAVLIPMGMTRTTVSVTIWYQKGV